DAWDLLALPLLDAAEPGAQGAGTPGRLCRRQPQPPAQEAIPLLADVAGADSIRAGADAWREPDVAGQVLAAREALDVAEFEHQEDGQERADARDGHETLHAGGGAPLPAEPSVGVAGLRRQDRHPR